MDLSLEPHATLANFLHSCSKTMAVNFEIELTELERIFKANSNDMQTYQRERERERNTNRNDVLIQQQ